MKNAKTTSELFVDSLSPKERREFDAELRAAVLQELILALMEQDDISVRKLAEMADVSPTLIQAMRSGVKKDFSMSSFIKIMKGLGCEELLLKFDGKTIPLELVTK